MRTALGLLTILCGLAGSTFAAEKPNVLLICVDDLKPRLGCYGDDFVQSPHIDQLAASGLLFESAYCNQAVCAPSRNSLLSGLRPQTLGIYDLGTNFRESRPDAVTLPQYFKQHGYRTEAMGKIFHVGHGNHEDPASWSVDHWKAKVIGYALPESGAEHGLTREEARFSNKLKTPPNKLPRGAAYERADVPDEAYPDGLVAQEAVRRIHNAAKSPDQPFFIAVGFLKPHLPFCAPKKYWDLYDPAQIELATFQQAPAGAPDYAPTNWGELRQYRDMPEKGDLTAEQQRTLIHGYLACISFTDAQVGKVLHALKQSGLDDSTIVVLWGDHGWHLGDHGQWCKHTNYEQAAHIPVLFRAPGVTKAGTRTSALMETVDIYPTVCDLAGLPVPKELDGTSFVPVLEEPSTTLKQSIIHVYPRGGGRLGRAIRTDRYRLVEWKKFGAPADTAEFELYDYQDDPLETHNLAADHPQVVQRLQMLLAEHPQPEPPINRRGKKK